MILLAAGKGRWDFAELCNKVQELDKKYVPEFFIVEDTSAGLLLIPEMQKRSLPVIPYKPKGDKTARLQATTPYFQAKRVYVPANRAWAEAVVAEVSAFQPRLKNQSDDYADTVSQAVIWMRDNYKIDNDGFSNKWDEEVMTKRRTTYWSALLKNKSL
jgi:predicted phage terminase large subunit-like protein